MRLQDTSPHYILIVDRIDNLDTLEVQVELTPEFFSDEVKYIENFEKKIKKEIEATLGISAKVKLVEPKTYCKKRRKS